MIRAHRLLDPARSPKVQPGQCALGIMTKAPQAGKVKTRLIPPLTAEEAADLNICFLRDLACSISDAAKAGHAVGVGIYTPVGAEETYRGILPDDFFLIPQRGENFGERLTLAVEDLLQLGFESVCLINSDSPTISSVAFAEAAEVLGRSGDRVVLGPSDDGGYYLIGLKKSHRRIFEAIDWSTEKVFAQTRQRVAEMNLELHVLPGGFDVDDRATLYRLCEEVLQENSTSAPATQAFLSELIGREGRNRIWAS